MGELDLLTEQLDVMKDQLSLLRIYTWATVGLAGIALIAGVAAWLHLRGLRHEREWVIAREMMEELRSPERIELQRTLWNSKFQPTDIRNDPRIHEFEILISRQEWIGILVTQRVIPIRLVTAMIGGGTLRLWYMLGEYVVQESDRRGRYGDHFRQLVRDTLHWYVSHEPTRAWHKLSRETLGEEIDLVSALVKDREVFSPASLWAAKARRCVFGLRHWSLWSGTGAWWHLSTTQVEPRAIDAGPGRRLEPVRGDHESDDANLT